jgi:hypothetical protein
MFWKATAVSCARCWPTLASRDLGGHPSADGPGPLPGFAIAPCCFEPGNRNGGVAPVPACREPRRGSGFTPGLPKLAVRAIAQRGSAAPTCGKPPAFRPMPQPCSSAAQAGRFGLPACAAEVTETPVLRKGEAFPQVRRRSPGPDGPGRSRRSSLTELRVIWTSLASPLPVSRPTQSRPCGSGRGARVGKNCKRRKRRGQTGCGKTPESLSF